MDNESFFMINIGRLILILFLFNISGIYTVDAAYNGNFVYVFAHGLGADYLHVEAYKACGVIPKSCKCLSENGPEVEKGGPTESSLAQSADMDVVIGEIEEARRKYGNDCKIILVGVSKGAATMINTIGALASAKSDYLNNIKAVILDSPFADLNDVACDVVCPKTINCLPVKYCLKPVVKSLIRKCVYKNYDSYGIQPIKAVQNQWNSVNKDMLVVFFHSKNDELINVNHSKLLSSQLKKLGFNNTYFIQTSLDQHANIFWGHWPVFSLSRLWIIYRKYGLPLPRFDEITDRRLAQNEMLAKALATISGMSDLELNKLVDAMKNGCSTETIKN